MLRCLWHYITISLIPLQHQLTLVTCMHKCNAHAKFIQSSLSLSFSPPRSNVPNVSIDYRYCFRFHIRDSFPFVQLSRSYTNTDLDRDQLSTCASRPVLLVAVLLSVGSCDFYCHKIFKI